MCRDSQCAPQSADPPPSVNPAKCMRAQLYHHYPSGSSYCGSINQNTGQFEQLPEKCCHTTMAHMWDLSPDYAKWSLGPQYYGMRP